MRFRSLGKTTPLYALIIAACVGLFSLSVSADNMLSSDQLARAELINSVDVLSGVTNSGVSDILGVDIVPVVHDIDELSSLSGVTDTGSTNNSGSTGAIVATPPIDYSTYSYYDGLFEYDGKTYGNGLYPDTMGFSKKIDGVNIYSYNEYLSRQSSIMTNDLDKKNQKSSIGAKNQKIGNTMMSSSMTAFAAPTNGLVAEYLLDGNANDSSGNGNHGAATNVTWLDNGNGDGKKMANFNGTNAYISLPNLGDPSEVTISIRAKSNLDISTYSSARGLFHSDMSQNAIDNGLQITDYGSAVFLGIGTNVSGQRDLINSNISNGEWKNLGHYVITYNKTSRNYKLYYNNVLKISGTGSYYIPSNWFALPRLGWSFGTGFPRFYGGVIKNVRIYNRALSASEISDLYNEGSTPSVSNTTSSGYVANYISSNPLASIDPRYFEQFKTISNTILSKQNSDEGVIASMFHAVGDPVNLATGEFGYDNTLMKIPGVGLPYELSINYKNQASYNGPLGFNWDHNYNQYLTVEANGNVLYANGKLGTFRFIKNGSIFVRNEGLRANLVLSGGLYTINYDDGTRTSFNAINRISSYTDQNNNTLNFNYSGQYLSGVVDTLGRTISYTYYDHNRLRTVTDFTGRKVDFNYYTGATASGNLYDLKDIILTNSGTTKKISFEYSTGSSEPQIHNITRLIDAKGQIYVENTYDTGDRVATQKYGDGTLTYTYTLSGGLITQNTVVDKVGNRTDYTYDASGNNTSTRYYNPAQTGSVLYGYTYSTGGLVLTETRPRGNGYRYSYDTNGNLTSKRLKANMSLADSTSDIVTSYTYNTRNEKLTETLANGAQVIYTRDSSGNILTKTQSGVIDYNGGIISGITTNYAYYSGGLQKSILTPFGRWSQFYYSSGQISKIVNYTGALTSTGSFTYSPYGTVLTATDGDGYTKTYEYSPFDLPTKQTTALGIITTYDYDANNNKTRESRYLTGGSVMNSYFYYDSLDHLTGSLVDIAPGQTLLTTYLYDTNGNVMEKKVGNGALIKYKYNEFSKVIEERIILVPGNSTEDIVTTYTYDTNNNLVSKTDPRGYTTTYAYDLYDRLTRETDPQGAYRENSYNKDNTVNTISTYTSTGLILTRKSTLYDNYGHITKSIDYLVPATNTGTVEQRYTYTPDFDPYINYHDSTDNNNRTMIAYDLLYFNRKTTFDPMNTTITETFNKRNIKAEEWHSTPGGGSIPTWYQYDADGRLTRATDYLGKYKSYAYDHLGYVTRTTDEIGRVTDITRDYRGLMLTSTSYSGSTPVTTTYTYDDRGNMTSIVDPLGRTTSYQYDGINRNTKIVYPDLKEMIYAYDKNSNLLTKTDPNGTVVTNTYNSLNQLTNRTITRGVGVGGITSEIYSYDQLGRLISAGDNTNPTGSGAPTYTGSAVTNLTFTYDPLSRLKSETQNPLGGTGYTVGYNYSTIGDLTSITLPDGKIQTISYDRAHRPLITTYSGQTISTNRYDRSFLTGTTYGNGRSTSYGYDTLNRLSSIDHGSGIVNPIYTYNDASDILGDSTKSYTYDSLMRLISATPVATGSVNELYSYDKTGNRTTSSLSTGSTSYTTNTLDQYTALTGSIYSGSLTYDSNGNIKTQGNRSYAYDYNNRIIEVTIGTGIIAKYSYDTLGRRTSKIDPSSGISTLYIYHGDNIISEYKTTGSLTTRKNYINGIGTDHIIAYDVEESGNQDQIAFCQSRILPYQSEFTQYGYSNIVNDCNNIQSSATGVTNNLYYYHLNQLGSVISLTDTTGTVVQNYSYDAFGKVYSSNSSSTYSNSRLFTGREYDRETGLYYHRARYYDSDTGRFLSRDPIGQNDQVNLYTYVKNSPLMYTDRDGKIAKQIVNNAIVWLGDIADSLGPTQIYGDLYPAPIVKKDIGIAGEAVIIGGGFLLPGGKKEAGERVLNDLGKIVNGHAIEHLKEFEKLGVKSVDELEEFGKNIINSAIEKGNIKSLSKGRTMIWDDITETAIFHNPNMTDKGTIFIHNSEKTTFDNFLDYISSRK